jgi:hypothetical protein
MDSQNQLAKQYRGFLDTPPLFEEIENFKLFSVSEIKPELFNHLKLSSIPENMVLGKRVELFFHHFIENSKIYDLLAANLQIIENKVTLGELDFLIIDTLLNQFLHLELVYKFYLYDPEIDGELQRWIGPNRRDTLLFKIKKLKNKQLPLLQNTATKPYLNELKVSVKEFVQQVCFLGKLYVPLNLYNSHFPKINNKCIVGFWLTFEAFLNHHHEKDVYCLPTKKNWLLQPEDNTDWVSLNEIMNSIEKSLQNKKSLLCWKKTYNNQFEQFFVVWW